jgi:hypothetical protein
MGTLFGQSNPLIYMPPPLHPPESTPLASLVAFFQLTKHFPSAETFERDSLLRWHTPVAHPWFNGVLASRPPTGNENSTIQETLAYFRGHHVASSTWWLAPGIPVDEWAS